ncbi:hypothetical protein B7R22_07135 [Subtercola boreus]|uniref:Uncharacterized protein n=1 Tax=Subtercola boreus TaxID=120213 RepID=A0A3E0W020_9MICO|nr:hypothetical protein [Subtercola boreus]RFA15099.1 hypothetical protein B7R22_07135 [Subtercola boreus]
MTDETQNTADEAPARVPAAETGYVLTRRDRTAIHFIDWAVRFGTPEFQERYRPVTDELFTHVYIDPTAKPAFVPPALASIQSLDEASDPLEIVRSHLAAVIDDRKERDRARVELQVHYEESERNLAELRERAADLQQNLTETTGRLEAADARIVALGEQLEAEVSGLHSSHAAELAGALAGHEASIASLTEERDRALAELAADRDAAVAALTEERDSEVARLEAQLAGDTAAQRAEHEQQIEALRAEHDQSVEALGMANTQAGDEVRAEHHLALTALEAAHAAAVTALNAQLAASAATAEATTQQLRDARLEAGSLTAQRDRAIAEGSEWRNRLQQTVAALATTLDVGEWTNDNAPDARLVDFISESQLALASELELARATIDEIEEVATAQLVDESETGDYAIGANDAAVLVLNSLYGTDDAEVGDGDDDAGDGAVAGVADASPDDDSAQLAEIEEADAEFAAELRDEVDVPFEEAAEREAEREPHPHHDAAIGHTAVIEHTIVRDETPEIDDVDKLGSLFSDEEPEANSRGGREHRRAS